MTGDELVHEIQDLLKGLLKQGAKLPKNLMLYVKNMIFFDGATTRLAPDVNLFEQVTRIYGYFAQHHADRIVRDIGFDPRLLALDLDGVQAHARARGRDARRSPSASWSSDGSASRSGWKPSESEPMAEQQRKSGTGRAPGHHSLRTPAGLHPVGGGSARDGAPARRRAERARDAGCRSGSGAPPRGCGATERTGTASRSAPRAALDFVADHDGPALFLLKDFHEAIRDSAGDPPPAARPLRALPRPREVRRHRLAGEVHPGRDRARPSSTSSCRCPTCSS